MYIYIFYHFLHFDSPTAGRGTAQKSCSGYSRACGFLTFVLGIPEMKESRMLNHSSQQMYLDTVTSNTLSQKFIIFCNCSLDSKAEKKEVHPRQYHSAWAQVTFHLSRSVWSFTGSNSDSNAENEILLWETHTHRFQAWLFWPVEPGVVPFTFIIDFLQDPLVLSAPLCFASWIFSFPGL